jgi:HK97 family phage prohead protease
MSDLERRLLPLAARRVAVERRADGKAVCAGYAAVFYNADDPGTEYELIPGLRERVMPACFDRCLREGADVRGLFNHDPNHLLGRTEAGTMRLKCDKVGLRYEIDLPDTQTARDVAEMIQRGDLTGSSFSFAVRVQKFAYASDGDQDDIRELHDVELYDVGPVSFPAYNSTTTGLRAGDVPAEVRSAWQTGKADAEAGRRSMDRLAADGQRQASLDAMRRRLRLSELEED